MKANANHEFQQFCETSSPTCPCQFCTSSYHCPICSQKASIRAQCTREEEQRAFEEARTRERKKAMLEEEGRRLADDVAESVVEFFEAIAGVVEQEQEQSQQQEHEHEHEQQYEEDPDLLEATG
jgi:hypothetical protein